MGLVRRSFKLTIGLIPLVPLSFATSFFWVMGFISTSFNNFVFRLMANSLKRIRAGEQSFQNDSEEKLIAMISSLFTYGCIQMKFTNLLRHFKQEVALGEKAPDAPLYLYSSPDDDEESKQQEEEQEKSNLSEQRLLSLVQPGRPLVVNFGSCT